MASAEQVEKRDHLADAKGCLAGIGGFYDGDQGRDDRDVRALCASVDADDLVRFIAAWCDGHHARDPEGWAWRDYADWQRSDMLEAARDALPILVRGLLLGEAEKLERPNELGEDFTAASVRKVKAQGIRDAAAAFNGATPDPEVVGYWDVRLASMLNEIIWAEAKPCSNFSEGEPASCFCVRCRALILYAEWEDRAVLTQQDLRAIAEDKDRSDSERVDAFMKLEPRAIASRVANEVGIPHEEAVMAVFKERRTTPTQPSLSDVREWLKGEIDGTAHLCEKAAAAKDRDGTVVHGTVLTTLRDVLAYIEGEPNG